METIREVLKHIVKQAIIIYESGQQTLVAQVTLYDNGQVVQVETAPAGEEVKP